MTDASDSSNSSSTASPPSPDDSSAADVDDYRDVWLKIWNNSSDPAKMSCVTAFDILYYCFSPAHQLRALYRTGQSDLCQKALDDVKLCARIKAGKLSTHDARVRQAKLNTSPSTALKQWPPIGRSTRMRAVSLGCLCVALLSLLMAQLALRASRDSYMINEPHVWEWRTEPPEQFRPAADIASADTTNDTHSTNSTSDFTAHPASQPTMR